MRYRSGLLAVLSLLALTLSLGTAAAQGNSEAAYLCRGGGYLDYVDANGNG